VLLEKIMVIVQLRSGIFMTNVSEDCDISDDDTALQPNHLPNGSADILAQIRMMMFFNFF
jgi:hypothetical protein